MGLRLAAFDLERTRLRHRRRRRRRLSKSPLIVRGAARAATKSNFTIDDTAYMSLCFGTPRARAQGKLRVSSGLPPLRCRLIAPRSCHSKLH